MARLDTHGGSGDEGRIRAHYKRIRSTQRNGYEPVPESALMMRMARRWKRPIKEIRRIVGRERK